MNDEKQETKQERELMPLWEVFIRPRTGLSHSHVGSVHASDEVMAVQAARVQGTLEANLSFYITHSQI